MTNLHLTLKPYWENDTVSAMDVSASIEASALPAEGPALNYCHEGWNCVPFASYDLLSVRDDDGDVAFELGDAPSNWEGITYKGLYFQRPISGILQWSYRIFPRVLPEGYTSSPYYDFRSEPYGLNGSGFFAFMLPQDQVQFKLHLHWDLAAMPVNSRGVWSLGSGDTTRDIDAWGLRFTFFAVGVMQAVEDNEFGIYWFGEPPFDIDPIIAYLQKLFASMTHFFHDSSPAYRVFLRRDPFEKSMGGSAASRSFITGYSAMGGTNIDDWLDIIAHEMVHNWPMMDDRVRGSGTWYTEGTAEYYSAMLPYRAGLVDAAYTARQINRKSQKRYYHNPYRETPNMELPAIEWVDRRAQTVAYVRGFIYLGNVEAQLQRLGKGSIDEITVLYMHDNPMQPDDWIAFIRERLGEQGLQDYEAMKTGKLLVPDPDIFGGDFRVFEEQIELNGEMVESYRWEAK